MMKGTSDLASGYNSEADSQRYPPEGVRLLETTVVFFAWAHSPLTYPPTSNRPFFRRNILFL